MGAWASNLNQAVRISEPDQGSWFDLPYSTMDLEGHTGLRLTLSTTPYRVLSSAKLTVKWDASSSVAAYLKAQLPSSLALRASKTVGANTYNIAFARLRLVLAAMSGGLTDVPGFTVTGKSQAFGGAVKATFTSVFKASVPMPESITSAATNAVTPTTPAVLVYDFFDTYGAGPVYIAPGDDFDFTITPDAHTTDVLTLHGLRVQAALNPAYTLDALRQV